MFELMADLRTKGKAVRDTKQSRVEPSESDNHKIKVVPGNVPLLIVQMLNMVNNNLVEIKEALQKRNG